MPLNSELEDSELKVKLDCIPCIIDVRRRELRMMGLSEERAVEVMAELVKLMGSLAKPDVNVTRLASTVYRRLKSLTVEDPYAHIRAKSLSEYGAVEEACRGVLRGLEGYEKFKKALRLALIGNSFDYGVSGFQPPESLSLSTSLSTMDVSLDDSHELYERVKRSRVLYLLDNVEELPFDAALMRVMKELGCQLIAVAKSGCFQNDTTIRDALAAGLDKLIDKVVESGTDGSSIFLDEVSEDLLREVEKAEVIVAKGMAHFEYLSETSLRSKCFFLLRAKCHVVAEELKVRLGSYVVLNGSKRT